jgi:hypothetical protein
MLVRGSGVGKTFADAMKSVREQIGAKALHAHEIKPRDNPAGGTYIDARDGVVTNDEAKALAQKLDSFESLLPSIDGYNVRALVILNEDGEKGGVKIEFDYVRA